MTLISITVNKDILCFKGLDGYLTEHLYLPKYKIF